MSLTITSDQLRDAGLSECEAQIEIACRLYNAEKISMPTAVRWSGLPRSELEEALLSRGLWLLKPKIEDVQSDITALREMGSTK